MMAGAPPHRWRERVGTVRFRVSAVAALAVVLVLTAAGVALVLAQRSILLQDLDESLVRQADLVATRLEAGAAVDRTVLLSDDAAVLVSGPHGDAVAGAPGLIDRIFRYGPAPVGTAALATDLPGPDGGFRVLSRRVDESSLWVAAPLDEVRDSTAALVRSLLIAVPISAAVLAGLVWWTVGRTLRPVEGIRAEVERISGTRLERRVPEPGTSDEIARLAHTMNDMLDRLDGTAEQQRRFVADAAHELRSPLARIRAELEVNLAHPGSADLAATQASVLTEAVRLQRLVDDLLLLARADAGAADLRGAGPVDLDDVVERLAMARRPHGDRQIDTRGVVPAQVSGHRPQLERAVANLLDNAVRHARSRVVVTLEEKAGAVVLAVADDGPGVPVEAGELVFQRFTRLDDARSANEGGAGLGLAIARNIVEQHGGRLTLDGAGLPGARFVLTLPGGSADAEVGVG
jgi:signal transduction histidine kinase